MLRAAPVLGLLLLGGCFASEDSHWSNSYLLHEDDLPPGVRLPDASWETQEALGVDENPDQLPGWAMAAQADDFGWNGEARPKEAWFEFFEDTDYVSTTLTAFWWPSLDATEAALAILQESASIECPIRVLRDDAVIILLRGDDDLSERVADVLEEGNGDLIALHTCSYGERMAPTFEFSQSEIDDQLTVSQPGRGSDWSHLQIRANRTISFAIDAPATATSNTAAADTWTDLTATSDPMNAGDYIEFCGPNGAMAEVSFDFRDMEIDAIVKMDILFTSIAAC